MAITTPPEIAPYPEAPRRGQPESVFIPTANTFVASLEPRRVEMQALADWMKTAGDYIDTTITDNKTAIDTVHASIADVNTVADDIANVNTAAANISDVNTVATNIADVNKVAAIDGDVSAVAASDLAVNTVATDIANVNTAAGSIADVNTVAANIASVNTTATNIADVNTVAANTPTVQAAVALAKRQSLYARSLALNPPITGETLRLDYANRAYGVGDADVGLIDEVLAFETAHTFTRGSTKWTPNALGVLTECGIDEPAYTYDPETGEPLGLLIEEQRTNLLPNSNTFPAASGITVTASGLAPDGVSNAFEIVSTSDAVNDGFVQQGGYTTVSGQTDTYSVFIKSGTVSSAEIRLNRVGAQPKSIIVNIPNDGRFHRFDVTQTWTDSRRVECNLYPNSRITKNIGDSVIVAFGQLEQGTFPTSYTPTSGSQVTRAADSLWRTLGAEFNASEGSLSVTAAVPTGETVVAMGSQSIVSDSDAEKTYTLSYSAGPSATTLDIAPNASVATIKSITYTLRAE